MTPKEFQLEFARFTYRMVKTMKAKNADYAGNVDPFANFKAVERLGIASAEMGILTRMTDKLCRVTNILSSGKANVKDESIEDTLLDNAVYSIILALYIRNKKNEQ